MQTVLETPQTGAEPDAEPRPVIDPADALTLVPRLLGGFFLGGLAAMHLVAKAWGLAAFLAFASVWMLYWAYRLMKKMRDANRDYIVYRTAEDAAKRARKEAARRP